jgi:hypothetical protein
MLLPPDEADLFLRLYTPLISFVAGRLGGVAGIHDLKSFRYSSMDAKAKARDAMLDNIRLLDEYLRVNPDSFSKQELEPVSGWKRFVKGYFAVVRDLKGYTVFMDEGNPPKAYGVLGLTTEIADMLPVPLPAYATAVLLPWKGRIVTDGLVMSYNIVLGRGICANLREAYREAKARGIITSLDERQKPEPARPLREAKQPAIVRFLKKCPMTVAEFKARYGEPRMDMAGDAAREYGVWRLDGTPALEADALLIYANVIKNQVLYVYAKGEAITHVAVVDPTNWRGWDFKPQKGWKLIT